MRRLVLLTYFLSKKILGEIMTMHVEHRFCALMAVFLHLYHRLVDKSHKTCLMEPQIVIVILYTTTNTETYQALCAEDQTI